MQQPLQQRTPGLPKVSIEQIFYQVKNSSGFNQLNEKNLKSVDIKPELGVIVFRTKDDFEIQVDSNSGEVVSSGKRWSSFFIKLHEGSLFYDGVRTLIFIPAGILLFILLLTGTYLMLYSKWPWGRSPY
jgi:hypothetical protein